MTASEAIKMLEIQKPAYGCKEYQKPLMYAYEMAIKALEEVQQYRAIGTPEELQAAKEKQILKKPRFYTHNYYCSVCDNLVGNNEFEWRRFKYCDTCGQRLDWSDEE